MVVPKLSVIASLGGTAFAAGVDHSIPTTLNLQPSYHNGTVSIEDLSVAGNLDGFKILTPAARGSADFWYFDTVSTTTNQTLNIVFYNSGEFAQYPQPLAVQVSGTFDNGTGFYYEALANEGVAITNDADGIRGDWKGIGSFKGSALDKPNVEYVINLDSTDLGIRGSVTFESIAPARYPCALSGVSGAIQALLPGFYWTNAIPDARATVNLSVGDTNFSFSDGIGYHDKIWGNKSVADAARYWDWGHSRFGPYSVVWYNLLDYQGRESRRSFVYKDGEVLLLSCADENLEVRQKGGKAAWPPTTGLLETEGVIVTFTLPDSRVLFVNVTTDIIVRDELGAYQRANGNVEGGFVGQETYKGRAHFDEFSFGIVNDYEPSV